MCQRYQLILNIDIELSDSKMYRCINGYFNPCSEFFDLFFIKAPLKFVEIQLICINLKLLVCTGNGYSMLQIS